MSMANAKRRMSDFMMDSSVDRLDYIRAGNQGH
jgi:hypothetical protein